MADHLKVDPVDLRMSTDHVDMHLADLQTAHSAANDAIEGARSGWVGASAAAVSAKFAEWEAVTAELTSNLAAHGTAFTSAAGRYESVDTESAETLDGQV